QGSHPAESIRLALRRDERTRNAPTAIIRMIERTALFTLNHLLDGAPWARARLAPFAGRPAHFDIPPFAISFAVTSEGRLSPSDDSTPADVVIRLPADTAFPISHGLDEAMSKASVEGNAEFATALSFVFRNLHWDVEEDLSHLVGDIAAHRLMLAASRFFAWHHRTATNLVENLAEFLVHEKRFLVARDELLALQEAIARLATDLDRVDVRLSSLSR
ncbi:MAG: SCP2 domain-containing protein, partial [Rhodocyclaceae bacterium]